MKTYNIEFFNAASFKKIGTFKLPSLFLFLLPLIYISLTVALLITLNHISQLRRQVDEIFDMEFIYAIEETTMQHTQNALRNVISILEKDELFAQDILTMSVMARDFNYDTFTDEFTRARVFSSLINLEDKTTYKDIPKMLIVIEMLDNEINIRKNRYLVLIDHLDKQNIVFRHTPSIWPANTSITSQFGFRASPFTGIPTYHEGTDFNAPTGTPIKATADGVVVYAGPRTGYGYLVTIDHGFGYMTRYGHNSRLLVKAGDRVNKGDYISLSGSTGRSAGPHLHYEVLYNGCPVNAIKFLP